MQHTIGTQPAGVNKYPHPLGWDRGNSVDIVHVSAVRSFDVLIGLVVSQITNAEAIMRE